ncbi:MAG: type II secretion system protein GspL [Pseudomonadota bacterium]|nr:type II secretion system protein GspL [Pseudomonadota bacterium]
MVENLTVRFFPDSVDWIFQDKNGRCLSSGKGQLEEMFVDQPLDEVSFKVSGILAGEQVLLTSITVPSKPTRQIIQVVPYLAEEQLASDVEDCFFAIGKRTGDELSIAVVDRAWFEGILDSLKAVNLSPLVMAVETDLLSLPDQSAIYIDDERAHLLLSARKGLSTEIDQLSQLVTLTSPELTETVSVVRFVDDHPKVELVLDEIATLDTLNLVHESQPGSCLEYMASRINSSSLDMLQGPYAVRKKQNGSGSWLKTVVWATLGVLLFQFCLMLAEGIYINNQAEALATESEKLYRSVYPRDKNISNMRRRWNGHLGQVNPSAKTGFMGLLSQAAAPIRANGLEIQNINYNESRGDLVFQLEAQRSEQLMLYVERLSDQGMDAEIGTISQDDGRVRGSIRIRSGGGRK